MDDLKPCKYGVETCMCCWCEKPCNNGLQCWECDREGKAVHNTYICTGFVGIPPWERMKKMDEYIDREKVLHKMKMDIRPPFAVVQDFPAADVALVIHARWEECDYVEPCVHGFGTIRHPNAGLKCKNCLHVFQKELLFEDNYCPNCGAKMDL